MAVRVKAEGKNEPKTLENKKPRDNPGLFIIIFGLWLNAKSHFRVGSPFF